MNYLGLLKEQFNNHIDFRVKRPGIFQLIAPLFHEDGDMVNIFLEQQVDGGNVVRVCDYGMTLMRLSYTYELDSPKKEKIFHKILSENQVNEENGNLYIDAKLDALYPAILQFAQTVAKVSNMQLYKREVIQSLFYEMLAGIIEEKLKGYSPRPSIFPLPDRDDLEVDFQFEIKPRPIFLFGVKDAAKSRLVTISCLEFLRANIPFKSFIVHRDFDGLGRKDRKRITSAADKQFPSLDDFRENGLQWFEREAA